MQNHYEPTPQLPVTPLHEMIFSWGRRLWSPPAPAPKPVVSHVRDEGSLAQQMEKLTVQQLATSLRMHGLEDDTLLMQLESMALAGEMSFEEFATRVKNLYPRTFENLDVSLRMKIAAMLVAEGN